MNNVKIEVLKTAKYTLEKTKEEIEFTENITVPQIINMLGTGINQLNDKIKRLGEN